MSSSNGKDNKNKSLTDKKSKSSKHGIKLFGNTEKGSSPLKNHTITLIIAAVAMMIGITIFANMPKKMTPEPPTVTPAPTAVPTTELTVAPAAATPTDPTTPPPTQDVEPILEILPQYLPLHQENNDLAGWLKIEGTVVDYPVMHTPDDGEFYLYRTFDKKDDPSNQGMLFIDKNCTMNPRSTNLLVHGHNMRNGTMFNTLIKYKKESFYKEHPVFEFDTLYETGKYEIVSVFLSQIYYETDEVFKFYHFYNADTQEEFDEFIRNIKALELYDTGVTAQFGDLLVTLSTCEYSRANGRIVVVGRLIQ